MVGSQCHLSPIPSKICHPLLEANKKHAFQIVAYDVPETARSISASRSLLRPAFKSKPAFSSCHQLSVSAMVSVNGRNASPDLIALLLSRNDIPLVSELSGIQNGISDHGSTLCPTKMVPPMTNIFIFLAHACGCAAVVHPGLVLDRRNSNDASHF